MKHDRTEYLYLSARIRAIEGRLPGREKIAPLSDVRDASELSRILSEMGIKGDGSSLLSEAFAVIAQSAPDPTLSLFLQYPYDCHNVKALEKCRKKGCDPKPLLTDLGSIGVEALLDAREDTLPSLLPTHMSKGLVEAREAYAETGNPQLIDFYLDRAAFADMKEAANNFPLAAAWVSARSDLTDLVTCLRLLLMQNGEAGRAILQRAALLSGSIDLDFLLRCYDGGLDAFYQSVSKTPYASVFVSGEGVGDAERRADNYLIAQTRVAASIAYGDEIPVAYLLHVEMLCKNLRILLAGKRAGLAGDTIKSRMRDFYV